MSDLRVLSVASEVFPLIKTGGLADVAGALPGALAPLGIAVTTLLPGYPQVMDRLSGAKVVHRWQDLFGGPAALVSAEAAGLALLVLDAPHLYRRSGGPYQDSHGADWTDNAQRFAALALAAAEWSGGLLGGDAPDVVHAHDWQAALAPVYLRFARADQPRRRPATIVTIHNIAFQGQFPASLLETLRLPPEAFTIDGVEYYGRIGFLKGGLALADHITTVSPTYAIEIQGSEMGMGLEGLLRHRSQVLSGILNGVDIEVWNPATDRHLVAQYDAQRLDDRQRNKAALRQRFGLADDAPGPLVAVVSRLSWQKGMDLLLAALPRLIAEGGQLALLGAGDAALQAEITAARGAPSGPGRRRLRLRRRPVAPDAGRRGHHPGAVALRAVRADAALWPALWRGPAGGARRRPRRHHHRCQRCSARGRRRHRISVRAGRGPCPRGGAGARRAYLSRHGNLAPHPGARHGDGCELAPAGAQYADLYKTLAGR